LIYKIKDNSTNIIATNNNNLNNNNVPNITVYINSNNNMII